LEEDVAGCEAGHCKGTHSTGSDVVPRAVKKLRVRKQSRFVDGWHARPAFLVSGAEGIRVTWCILFVTIKFLFKQHFVVTYLRIVTSNRFECYVLYATRHHCDLFSKCICPEWCQSALMNLSSALVGWLYPSEHTPKVCCIPIRLLYWRHTLRSFFSSLLTILRRC
jgi:hypothetical protein